MAATRLITMHVCKGKSLAKSLKDRTDYALNDDKTEDGHYVSSYACEPETVEEEFLFSKKEYLRITGRTQQGDIIAYQIRQSFRPGEITPEEANKVGYETALRFTKGNHAFVVATHTDKEHIHNHVIFNSTTLDCTRKFRDFFFVGIALQRVSDMVCLEHGLSVIKPRKPGERERYDRYEKREPFRAKICADIDEVLFQKPDNFDVFLEWLKEKDYDIKTGKYVSILGKGQRRYIRLRSLGEGYRDEDIRKRIRGEELPHHDSKQRTKRWSRPTPEFDLLIDIQEKLSQGKGGGYTRWATVYNIKQMAQTLLFLQEHNIRDYELLAQKASDASERYHELSNTIKGVDKRLEEIAVLRRHIINYAKTRDVYVAYRKAGYSKKFFEANREQLTLHKAAKDAFSALSDGKIPRVKAMNEEYAELLAKKKDAYAEYRQVKKEMRDYMKAKHNVDAFEEMQKTEPSQKREKEKKTTR